MINFSLNIRSVCLNDIEIDFINCSFQLDIFNDISEIDICMRDEIEMEGLVDIKINNIKIGFFYLKNVNTIDDIRYIKLYKEL